MMPSSFQYVDAHCHLDLFPDFEAVARASLDAKTAVLTMTTTPRAWFKNQELARQFDLVEVALGLHPQLVDTHFNDLPLWIKLLEQTQFVGEVGLDASPKHYSSFEKQKKVFETILRCCVTQGNKVLSVHSVRAGKTVLDMIEAHLQPSDCKVILHWFTGSRSEALRAVALGCYFSINQQMLQTRHHSDMIRAIPEDRILTESDGPFTISSGSPCGPASMRSAIAELAIVLGVTAEELRMRVCSNFKVLLA